MYDKPHLTYEQQLSRLVARGITCDDEARALALLRAVGYYRLSAYVYPFREMLASESLRTSPVHYRSDQIRPGTTFKVVEDLWRFDRRLRLKSLDALEVVEIGLRTHVAYTLGARHSFGHLQRNSLDTRACDARRPAGSSTDEFQKWCARYEKLKADARDEDFLRHHLTKYGDPIPVWVAVEFLDFGATVRLLGLLDRSDQNDIAKSFGISGGPLLHAVMRNLNYVRNVAAHHRRLWNRSLTYSARAFNESQVGPDLRHVARIGQRDRTYVQLAFLAYLLRTIDPSTTWPSELKQLILEMPPHDGLSSRDMGFPADWETLPLWRD